ncbi:MAG: recombinase family protein [Candidatus Yanofskybacteria bacterium]|nr:recombinase family protein [Candidatus Yanofskybacteria bacterium]
MRYIIYARKSTEDEDRQVLSIEAQLHELKEFAAKEKLEIVASLCEAKTAKEPGRIKFAEMLAFLEQNKADGILSWHPDRLARNSVDGGKIIHFVDKGFIKALKFPTFWFEPTPQGKFMLQIAFGQSKYYVDNLSENVKRGLRQKIRRGEMVGVAPTGYFNNLANHKMFLDPERAPLVKKLFELYASGNYNILELKKIAEKIGLRSKKGKVLTHSNIQYLLQKPFYYGLIKFNGEFFEGTHEPLLSKKLFDKVQEVMKEKGKPRGKTTRNRFAFIGLMKCGSCSCSITAEIKKGHHYYRCTKKKGSCPEKYLREEALIEQISFFLQKVSLSSQDTEKVLAKLSKDENQAKEMAKTTVQNLKNQLSEVEFKLDNLLDLYLAKGLSQDEYVLKKQKILTAKLELQEKTKDFEQKGLSWLEPAREFVLSLNQAAKLLETKNYLEMPTFLKNIGSNHILRNRQFCFEPKIPYDSVAAAAGGSSPDLLFSNWLGG